MTKRRRNKGFTLAEVLLVVGIIVILAGVSFINVVKHQRAMKQLEMDGIAKEIFVAAQNHLSMAASEGYLGLGGQTGIPETDEDGQETGVYYFVVNPGDSGDETLLDLMLPFGSVDETVRTGGSYIVRYQKEPALVLDVFYATPGGHFPHSYVETEYDTLMDDYYGEAHKLDRRKYTDGAVLGWYGGVEASVLPVADALEPPIFRLINAERLYATVRNPNDGGKVRLTVEGLTSGAQTTIELDPAADQPSYIKYEDGTFTVIFDDVTAKDMHFNDLFCTPGGVCADFVPGEDIRVTAVAYSDDALTLPVSAGARTENSLYAGRSGTRAEIGNIRHLENLAADISSVASPPAEAVQLGDLSWTAFKSAIGGTVNVWDAANEYKTKDNTFLPVTPGYDLHYDGAGHRIADVAVDTDLANAGVFGALENGGVSDLELLDCTIKNTAGTAGALAGSMGSCTVTGVYAHSSGGAGTVTGSGASGGLIGSASDVTVQQSAANLLVTSTNGAAGGLVGAASDILVVKNSYAAGHTSDGAYDSYNVTAAAAAGGLIGDASSASLTVDCAYSTCSVTGDVSGGLVGRAGSGTATHTYATGLVGGAAPRAFLGAGTLNAGQSRYYEIVNMRSDNTPVPAGVSGVTALDASAASWNAFMENSAGAEPFDARLVIEYQGHYFLPTVAQLGGDAGDYDFLTSHCGDWPAPETKLVNRKTAALAPGGRDGGARAVTMYYTGDAAIPDDADLTVSRVTGGDYLRYLAEAARALGLELSDVMGSEVVDISILRGGSELQPASPVSMHIAMEGACAPGVQIVHFGPETEVLEARSAGGDVTFRTAGFSVYALVSSNHPQRTYNFFAPDASGTYQPYYFYTDQGTLVCRQTIKTLNGVTDELVVPRLPASASRATFDGWYTAPEGGERFDFSSVPAVTSSGTVDLYARFADFAYVIFHEQYNGATRSWPVTATRRGELTDGSAAVVIDDITVSYDDSAQHTDGEQHNAAPRKAFRGWTKNPDVVDEHAVLESSPLTITGNVDLYPVFVDVHWLTFASAPAGQGATYIPPRFYYVDEGESSFPIPTRTGYRFEGWYSAETGGTKIVNADGTPALTGVSGVFTRSGSVIRITADATLYGRWSETETNYTVVIWQQKVTDEAGLADGDKSYDFGESFTLQAPTGTSVGVANTYRNLSGGDYAGFHFDRCDDAKTVTGDGQTVLNVYYDRNVHTLTFRIGGSTVRTITGLYGASVKDYFPIVGNNGTSYNGYTWTDSYRIVYNYVLSTIETMPDADVTFSGASRGTNKTIYYYTEIEDESESLGQTTTFNGRLYTLYKTVSHNYNYITYEEEYHPITGYTRDRNHANPTFNSAGQADIGTGNRNYLYYDRESYSITFVNPNNNATLATQSVKYRQKVAEHLPAEPTPPEGYHFTGWYADSACSTRVFFTEAEYNASTLQNKALIDRMPAFNLQLFAGWETEWYLIQIDPNGGEMSGAQSTWFWEPYNGDPIEEYTTVTRGYIEALNGTYYYALQDRHYYGLGDEWSSAEDALQKRHAYYTDDISDPAVDLSTRYEAEADAFRYAGWFEVNEDGSETLYAFGQPVMHNTTLRLHWKQIGTYHLRFEAGDGTLDSGDGNEDVFLVLDDADYADHARVVVSRAATVEDGRNFVGWTVRNDPSGTIYTPGQTFELQSKFAVHETDEDDVEHRVVILDAVYTTAPTARIIYDANGGTITGTPDYGAPTGSYGLIPVYTHSDVQATVTNLYNNLGYRLSDGTGFTLENAEFKGWSTNPDGTGDVFEAGQEYYIDSVEPVTLYAMWQVRVWFDKNNVNADWGGDWDTSVYTWDQTRQQYYTLAYVNGTVDEPPYTPASSDPEERFAYWSSVRYTDSGDVATPYDFAGPVAGEMTLYGFWTTPIQVAYHVVDSTEEALADADDWRVPEKNGIFLINSGVEIDLSAHDDSYVTMPEGYAYAFACLSDDMEDVSESTLITKLDYNTVTRFARATFADGSTQDIPADQKVYLIYYLDPEELAVGYKLMGTDGALSDAAMNGAGYPTEAQAGDCNMTSAVNRPLAWANQPDYKYFAYAIGDPDAASDAQLHLITASSNSDGSRPALRVKNTWRGFRYSTDGGSTWISCGYDLQLYVIYFESKPTVITLREHTVGLESDMEKKFTYTVVVEEIETTTVQTEQRTRTRGCYSSWGSWYWYDWDNYAWSGYSSVGTPEVTDDASELSSVTYQLSDGESETTTMFYTPGQSSIEPGEITQTGYTTPGRNRTQTQTETRTVTTTTVTQRITVTQTADDDFTTDNESTGGTKRTVYVWTYTTVENDDDKTVTYTNTRKQAEVELHVALAQGGGFVARDDLRTGDASVYTVTIPLGETKTVGENDPAGLFTGDSSYHFAGVIYSRGSGAVTADVDDVQSVSFLRPEDSEYYRLVLNEDNGLSVDDGSIWFVYYQMPRIYYMKEGANGALTRLGAIRRNGAAVELNDAAVTQGLQLQVGMAPFLIDQTVAGGYRVPPDLDGDRALSLDYIRLAAGPANASNTSQMDEVRDDKSLRLKVDGGQVKWSTDGETYQPFSGEPTIYAIYREKGYELTLTKTVVGSVEDEALTFPVTITSNQFTNGETYTVSGYGEIETLTVADRSLSLSVRHGDTIRIQGLQRGAYTIRETVDPVDFTMTAQVGGYNAGVTAGETQSSFSVTMDADKTAAITNTRTGSDVTLTKIDSFGQGLPGAVMTLYKGTEEVASATSGADGTFTFQRVQAGAYTLRETGIPDGYRNLGRTYGVTVDRSGNAVVTCIDNGSAFNVQGRILDVPTAAKRVIFKKTDESYAPLPGAKLVIRYVDGTTFAVESMSGTMGCFWLGDLPEGRYTVEETAAPAGYIARSYTVTVQNGTVAVE